MTTTIDAPETATAGEPPTGLNVTISQAALEDALAVVTRALGGRTVLPILNNVLLEAGENGLRLVCSDLEQRIGVLLQRDEAGIRVPGAFTVPARLLDSLVGTLSGELTLTQEGTQLRIGSSSGTSRLKGIDADEFPPEKTEGGDSFTLPAAVLREALERTLWAAARDESRPVLAGVHLAVTAHAALRAEAADGFACAAWSYGLPNGKQWPTFSAILPLRAVRELAHVLKEAQDEAALTLYPDTTRPNVLRVALAGERPVAFSCRLLEGQFPDLARVTPKTVACTIRVPSAPLLAALRRVEVVAGRESSSAVGRNGAIARCSLDGGQLTVHGAGPEVGDHEETLLVEARRDDAAAGATDPLTWALDTSYLRDAVEAADSETVELGVNGPLSPLTVQAEGAPGHVAVVMPMSTVA